MEITYSSLVHKRQSKRNVLVTIKGVKYGAFAGFIATLLISLAIAAAELASGLQIGTFYSVIGISLRLNNIVNATFLGFGLHVLIGSLLGTVLGAIGIRWKKLGMLIPYKGCLFGIGAGIVIWLIFFLPITSLLIQPSIQHLTIILAIAWHKAIVADQLGHSITNIVLAAIAFHIAWGAIFGFAMSALMRIRVYKIKQHYQDIMDIDPNILLVTVCDTNGNIALDRHRKDADKLLDEEESKKSLSMAVNSWQERNELSAKIGKGMYVLAEYEKVKRMTMPFGEDLLLYLTTVVNADTDIIYNKVRSLEAGLKY